MKALVLVAAALFAWALADVSPSLYRPGERIDTDIFHSGEMLLHGIKYRAVTENYHLPLSSITAALLIRHSPPGADAAWRALSAAIAFLLLLALGCELGAPWYGLAGAALLLFVSRFPLTVQLRERWHGHWGYLQAFFTLLVLAAAGLAVRHRREPTTARAWAVALALGATLLYRSTLVFFPPLLALLYWASLRRTPTRADWRSLAILGLAPYAFLLPWAAMNWTVHHRLILLEDGEANPIIIGGVLGVVEKEWARPPADLGLSSAGTGEVLVWAVRKVLSHPADYLLGYLRRLGFILLLNPLLFVFASLSFYFNRRKKEFQVLGLLCAYYVLIHGFMSFLREYFDPLWPLLAAASAAGLAPFLKTNDTSERARKASAAVLAGALAAAMALCLFVTGTITAYAYGMTHGGAAAEQRRLDAAIVRHPDESKLYYERAMRLLEAGDLAAALPDLRTASRLSPESPLVEKMMIWADLHQGDTGRFVRWNGLGDPALTVYGLMTLGKTRAANLRLAEMLSAPSRPQRIALAPFVRSMCERVRDYPLLRPACLDDALSRAESEVADRDAALRFLAAAERLDPRPDDRRRMIRLYRGFAEFGRAQAQLAAMIKASPPSAALWIERAELAARTGEARATLRFLDEARKLKPNAGEQGLIAELAKNTNALAARKLAPDPAGPDRAAAQKIEQAAYIQESRSRDLSLTRAAAAVQAGDRATALTLLAEARALHPDAASRRRIASLYAELKDFPPARALLDELIVGAPGDPALRVDRAALAAASGDRASALAFLTDARKLRPGPDDLRRMAYLHQELKDYVPGLSLFDALIKEQPKDAALRADRGLCRYLNGQAHDALADLQAAIDLDPGLWPASATLGAIYDAQSRHDQALDVYEAALHQKNGRPAELGKLLSNSRDQARKALGR